MIVNVHYIDVLHKYVILQSLHAVSSLTLKYVLRIYTFPHLAMPGRSYSMYFLRILWNSNVLLNKILYMQIAVYIYLKCFSFHQIVDKITTKLLLEGSQFTKWSIYHYPATARGFFFNDVIYSIHVYLKAMQQFTAWWSTHLPSDKQWVSKWHLRRSSNVLYLLLIVPTPTCCLCC